MSDSHTQASDPQSLLDRILNKIEDLATLEIVTAVGTFSQDQATGRYNADLANSPASILTKIELIEGDIVTVFHQETLKGDFEALREIHKEREAQGMQIVKDRVAAVKELVQLIVDLPKASQAEEGD